MTDIIANAKRLLEGATPGPWVAADSDILKESNGAFIGTISEYSGIDFDSEESANTRLAAAAPELAAIVASLTPEYIAEWRDNGVWAPIEMDGFDGTFANLRAAQGYIEVAKKQAPYEVTRIVRRLVSAQEVINE